jgi:hypothetical protein
MTKIKFPVIELVDRLCIAEIKHQRSGNNIIELEWYQNQFDTMNMSQISVELQQLKHIHNQIWDLEADLKSFNEHRHSLEEIGRRAIEIRNLNHQRIKLKNIMAEKLNCKVKEFKKDHVSQ